MIIGRKPRGAESGTHRMGRILLQRRSIMKLDEYLRLIAGAFVLVSIILGATVHPYWNYFAAFVALNLIQSAFTGWCPMMALLRKLGIQR